uniref:Uncharacterized protein n=1 Tax=Oryza rufipogon TaxID=4529 RepID=A0A0E0QCQ8_ORYRU
MGGGEMVVAPVEVRRNVAAGMTGGLAYVQLQSASDHQIR